MSILTDKNILIQINSNKIGDTLAWIPYVEEFRKKHNCKVFCTTFWNEWFVNTYTDIIFLAPGFTDKIENLYSKYIIEWSVGYKKIPLQKPASDILGLEYKEIVPKIEISEGVRPIKEKYVCIAQFADGNTKHWHYPSKNSNKGWQIIVDWLNAQGYKVMVISKQPTNLKNVIDRTGDFPIMEHRINELKWCEFFIGVSSGLSWLAWAVGKKVVMISGFSDPIHEFQYNNINVHNYNVCNGCLNREIFDKELEVNWFRKDENGKWDWCPEYKDTDRQFECSINITPQMIIDRIISSGLIVEVLAFDLQKYEYNIKLDKSDINIFYDESIRKIIIKYIGQEDTPQLSIDFKDFNTNKSQHVISDIILSRNKIYQITPSSSKILITFYEKNKILDVVFELTNESKKILI